MRTSAATPHYSLCYVAVIISALLPLELACSWQQEVAHRINVLLDTEINTLMGNETVVYINNSPDTLDYVWFHLYPNAYKDRDTEFAREQYKAGKSDLYFSSPEDRGYIEIISLGCDGRSLTPEATGTEMRVNLPVPIQPGDTVTFEIDFLLKLPCLFDRLGHEENRYQIAHWYPKMVVYDERGWHPDGYHSIPGFYGEFGTFDVAITLPREYIVGATGELLGPPEELMRLASLERYSRLPTKERRQIKHPYEEPASQYGYKTLVFHAENVHDFVWSASPDYLLKREYTHSIQIDLLLLPQDERKMKEIGTYTREAMELYREWFGPYPYRRLTIADGADFMTRGMAAPTLIIIPNHLPPYTKLTELVVARLVAQQWFCGVLGNNEIDSPWLDEAFATFCELRYLEEKYGEDYSLFELPFDLPYFPELDDNYVANAYYYMYASAQREEILSKPAYEYTEGMYTHQLACYKGALILYMLRDLLGHSTFDTAMKTYYQQYMFKHPRIEDFISVCEEVSGRELDWFFKQWLTTTKRCDYEVTGLKSRKIRRSPYEENPGGDYRNQITLRRNEPIVMPVEVVSYTDSGREYRFFWNGREPEKTITFYSWEKIKRVAVDPERKILDYNRWNNCKPRKYSFDLFFDKPSFDTYQLFFIPYMFHSPSTRLQVGGLLMGRQFILAGPLLGKHQWSFAPIYSSGKKTLRHSGSYQTPLGFWGPFSKLSLGWSRSWDYSRVYAEVSFEKREKLLRGPTHTFEVSLEHRQVKSISDQDPRDFSLAKYSGIDLAYSFQEGCLRYGGNVKTTVTLAKDLDDDIYQFGKWSLESQSYYRWSRKIKTELRLYGGYGWGDTPLQEYSFLSGKLIPEGMLGFTWESTGEFSPQQRWHIWGDGNLRGYFGRHLKGKMIATMSLENDLPYLPAYLFFDVGNVYAGWSKLHIKTVKSDFGIGFKFFIFRVDFPLWISHPSGEDSWKFRWIIGFTKGWQ